MDLQTITMPKKEARAKLQEYRQDLHKRASQQYEEAARGYEALAKGLPLINLSKTIQAGGFFNSMLPKLAIAPADRERVDFTWDRNSRFAEFRCSSRFGRSSERLNVRVDMGRPHRLQNNTWTLQGHAIVPLVPPAARKGRALRKLYTLWEVESWDLVPPRDPALLRHIGGELYAVLAVWDLTELERSILG